MKAYYLVFALSLIIQWVLPSNTDRQYRWKLFFTFLPLFVFGAIRVDFGLDYLAYEQFFDSVHGYSDFQVDRSRSYEIGFQYLCRILPSYRFLLVLNAFLLSLALGFFCYHNVPKQYLFLALILIFLNPEKNIYGSLVGIRNGLVVTCFLLGFVFVQKRRMIPFFVLIVLLSTIHKSTLLFLPIAYFIGQNKPLKRIEIYWWFVGFILLVGLGTSGIADMVTILVSNDYFERYEGYIKKGVASGVLMVSSSLVLLIVFILYLFRNRDNLSNDDNSILRMGMFYVITNVMGSLAARASYFYDMFFIAAVVKIVSDKRIDYSLRVAFALFVIVISCYSMFYVWMGKGGFSHGIYHSLLGDW